MLGTWSITRSSAAPIHSFTAPEDGWLVTSHIIELPAQLLIVDAQYTVPFAREVVGYANALSKPISRLYVTHYHPDHLLGAPAIDAPLYVLDSVREKIGLVGDRVAREEHAKVGDDIPPRARQPDETISPGTETIDGVQIEYRRLRKAETEDALTVAVPDANAIIVQDLVYNRAHLFLGEKDFDGWRSALREYKKLRYENVLPGHGAVGGRELYDSMIVYLDFAENALRKSRTAAEFRQSLLERFPDYGCHKVLEHQLRFLFR